MTPLLQSLFARYRKLSWGQRGYALIVLVAIMTAGAAVWNDLRARAYERMHQRISTAGARTTRSVTVVADPEEAYFSALLGDFSAVAVNGVIGNGPDCIVDAKILRDLRRYPELSALRLSHATLQPADFQQIWKLENLSRLNLSFNDLTDADLAGIEQLQSLTNLELQFTPLTDAAIPFLSRFPELSSIDITGTDITPAGAERLRQAYQRIQTAPSAQVIHRQAPSREYRATVLRLLPTNSYGADTRNGANWMRLLLRPDYWKEHEQEIPLLAQLTDVEAVYAQQMKLTPELFAALDALPKLHLLSISEVTSSRSDLTPISRFRTLRTLRLSGMQLSEEFISSLRQMESLETVSIFNCKFTPGACRALAGIKNLKSLYLRQLDLTSPAFTAEFTTMLWDLQNAPQLRLLELMSVPIDNDSIVLLGQLKQLISLAPGSKNIDDKAVQELCTFTHLRQLDLTGTGITLSSQGNQPRGAVQVEAALLPANVRVVHSGSKTFTLPMNLADLTAKIKAEAAAAFAAKAVPRVQVSAPDKTPRDKPPPP